MSADHSEVELIQKRLESAIRDIRRLATLTGHAKQVREFNSDQRKNLLARYMLPYLKGGASAASAEVDGRADPGFVTEFNQLGETYAAAETTIAQWTAAFATYEASRSLLSLAKETIRTIE
jgi:hypothetical protein